MLLVLEIILAVAAWRGGWKAWALTPIAVGLFLAFVFGAVMGASGESMNAVVAVGLLLDLAVIGTLVVMVARPRTAEQRTKATEAAAEFESVR